MDVNPQTDPLTASMANMDPASTPKGSGQEGSGEPDKDSLLSFIWFVVKIVIAALILRSLVFSPFSIPSESMLPHLWKGDYLIASKWPYGYSRYSLPFNAPFIPGRVFASSPERGDVVIFKHPVDKVDYIKRVIGVPGDTVALVDGQVILNGEALAQTPQEDFAIPISANTGCSTSKWRSAETLGQEECLYSRLRETLPDGTQYDVLNLGVKAQDNFDTVTVPEGHFFVLGDNRDSSLDSRFDARAGLGVGVVPQELLVGRAEFIVWSTDGSAQWIKPWTWFSAARWDRIGTGL